MGRKTSFEISDVAEKVLQKYEGLYPIKSVISAGIVAFGRFSAERREELISEAMGLVDDSQSSTRAARVEAIKKIVATITQPGYKILSQEESAALDELRKTLGPEKKESSTKKAKSG
jgi:ribosome recycling factor